MIYVEREAADRGCARCSLGSYSGSIKDTVVIGIRSSHAGTIDSLGDLLVGHLFHFLEGFFQLCLVDLPIITGVATDEVEGSEGFVLRQGSPLNEAVEDILSLLFVELSASVLVNEGEGFVDSWVLDALRYISAGGRRVFERPLALLGALFVQFSKFLEGRKSFFSLFLGKR